VIRVVVDHDLIGVPQPIAGEGEIVRRDTEEEPVEPETSRATAPEAKGMSPAEAAVETTVLPGMIEVVLAVVTTRVMTNPAAVRVHMRRIRMSIAVTE
jgi:hypothetical protein